MPPCHYHFFDVLLLLLFHSLPHLSFVFFVSRQGSLELCISFPLLPLSTFLSSFCAVSSTTASFSTIPSSAFSTSLKSVSIPLAFSSSRIFALNLSLKSVYRSLTDRFVTLNWGCWRLFRLFAILSQIWPLAMLPFFALNGSRTRISWQRILSCCSVHSVLVLKIKKNVNTYFLFVCVACCLSFFFTSTRTLFCSPNMQDTFTDINNREIIIY